jgi:hypothetical protein
LKRATLFSIYTMFCNGEILWYNEINMFYIHKRGIADFHSLFQYEGIVEDICIHRISLRRSWNEFQNCIKDKLMNLCFCFCDWKPETTLEVFKIHTRKHEKILVQNMKNITENQYWQKKILALWICIPCVMGHTQGNSSNWDHTFLPGIAINTNYNVVK